MLPRAAAVDDGGSAVADGRRAILFFRSWGCIFRTFVSLV